MGANTFSFAGVYATNQPTPGMINGGAGVTVPGWAPGTARDFVVFGWTLGSGVNYNFSWLKPDLSYGANIPPFFGLSSVSTGVAGGATSSGTVPALNIFGPPTGIQSGFVITGILVPEPSSIALLVLGTVGLLMRHSRKRTT
jgi:hypothetical protein